VSSFTRPNGAQCAPPDDAFAIDPKSMSYSPCDWRDKRRHLDAKLHLKSKRKQYMPFTSGRTGGRSWIVFMGLQGPSAVSRTTFLSMRTRGSVDAQTPVRGYFLSVGGALLVLLFAADSLLPAPLPSKLIESHSTLPPIRIASELKDLKQLYQPVRLPAYAPGQSDCSPLAAQLRCGRCCTTAARVIVRACRCE
jgi:hypothetical protein